MIEELEYHEVRTGEVTTWGGYRDGRAGEGSSGLLTPTDSFDVLLDAYRPCLRQSWIPRASASRMHLFAHKLTPTSDVRLNLFDREGWQWSCNPGPPEPTMVKQSGSTWVTST